MGKCKHSLIKDIVWSVKSMSIFGKPRYGERKIGHGLHRIEILLFQICSLSSF